MMGSGGFRLSVCSWKPSGLHNSFYRAKKLALTFSILFDCTSPPEVIVVFRHSVTSGACEQGWDSA